MHQGTLSFALRHRPSWRVSLYCIISWNYLIVFMKNKFVLFHFLILPDCIDLFLNLFFFNILNMQGILIVILFHIIFLQDSTSLLQTFVYVVLISVFLVLAYCKLMFCVALISVFLILLFLTNKRHFISFDQMDLHE